MARLSRSQQQAWRKIHELAAGGLAPSELGRAIMEALDAAVPNDGYRLFGIDPGTLLINRLLAASEEDAWARDEWLRDIYLASDPLSYIELPNLMRLKLNAAAVHERQSDSRGFPRAVLSTVSDREHYRAFHDLRSPVGGTLFGTFAADFRWVAALQLYRRDPGRPFRSSEVEFVRLLAPAIGRALAASIGRERALFEAAAPGTGLSGILILHPSGEVSFSTPAGEAWSDLLGRSDASPNGWLPSAVSSAVAAARHAASEGGVLVAPTAGGPLRIEASRADERGSIAVVLTPQRPPEAPGLPESWQLTAAERRVVELVLLGRTNRKIADALFVTENTVQTHLRHIFEKLGVETRSQILARYFREAFGGAVPGESGSRPPV